MLKKHHIIFAGLAIILAIALVVLYLPYYRVVPATGQQSKVAQYASPVNLEAYVQAEDKYTSSGGTDPALSWQFETKTSMVPEGSTTELYAAEVAANQIKLGGGPAQAVVTHFTVQNGTAYIVFNIDEDGWTGVSFALNKVHPIVERTLLLYPDITKVVFGFPPELQAEKTLQ